MTRRNGGMRRRAIIVDGERIVGAGGELPEGSAAAIRTANESGFQTLVLMRAGASPDDPWNEAHDKLREALAASGARVDGIYDRHVRFLARARDEMGIDLTASYLIGELGKDGKLAGLTAVPDEITTDLQAAMRWILDRERVS